MFVNMSNPVVNTTLPGARGPGGSMSDRFMAGYQEQSRLRSLLAAEAMLQERYEQNIETAARLSGDTDLRPRFSLTTFAYRVGNPEMETAETGGPRLREELDALAAQDRRLAELKEQFPEIETFDDIMAAVQADAQEMARDFGLEAERSGLDGDIANFVGAMAGSFTWRDPLNVATLGVGGAGSTLTRRILAEAGINASVEAFNQTAGVRQNMAFFGLEHTTADVLLSVTAAGAGAAALRGAFEVIPAGYRALQAAVARQRAEARAIADSIERNLDIPIETRQVQRGVTDEQWLEFLRLSPRTDPDVAAARADLETRVEFARQNPATMRFDSVNPELRMQQIALGLEGDPRASLFSGAAVARAPDFDAMVPRARGDLLREVGSDQIALQARADNPDVFAALDRATERLVEVERGVAEIRDMMAGRTAADALEAIDPASAARLREVEAELARAIPRARRAALEREADMIVADMGPEAAAREADAMIGPRRRLRDQQASLRARRREMAAARRDAEAAYDRAAEAAQGAVQRAIEDQPAIHRAVADAIRHSMRQAGPVARLMGPADRSAAPPPNPNAGMTQQAVRQAREAAERWNKDNATNAIMARASVQEDGTIDIGLPQRVPQDAAFEIEPGVVMSIRDIMADIAADDALVQAVRVCTL